MNCSDPHSFISDECDGFVSEAWLRGQWPAQMATWTCGSCSITWWRSSCCCRQATHKTHVGEHIGPTPVTKSRPAAGATTDDDGPPPCGLVNNKLSSRISEQILSRATPPIPRPGARPRARARAACFAPRRPRGTGSWSREKLYHNHV